MTAGAKPYTMKVVRTVFNGGHEETYGNATRLVPTQHGILLANLLQSSSSTFSYVSFPSFFAFKEGMWVTQNSALLNSPTVTHEPGLSTAYENREAIFRRVSGWFRSEEHTSELQ